MSVSKPVNWAAHAASRVLVVDDEQPICQTVAAILGAEGFMVDSAQNLQTAHQRLEHDYALLILDLVYPNPADDGLDLLFWLKQEQRRDLPVMILSALTRQETKLRAFELGADDYISKPFAPRELAARSLALLRRQVSPKLINFGPFRLDLKARTLHRGAVLIHVRPKEFDLLTLLASHPGQALSREELVQRVWGDKPLAARQAVAVAIHSLREKLEDDQSHPHYIRTVSRYGYRFEPGD